MTGATVEFDLDDREAAIEGMILIDLRMEVGSKKTAPNVVSFVAETECGLPYQVCHSYCSEPQCLLSSKSSDYHLSRPYSDCTGSTVR